MTRRTAASVRLNPLDQENPMNKTLSLVLAATIACTGGTVSANAAITSNALTNNALTNNALTNNALTNNAITAIALNANGVASNGAAAGTAARTAEPIAIAPAIKSVRLASGEFIAVR
jgi:hypothetical protein